MATGWTAHLRTLQETSGRTGSCTQQTQWRDAGLADGEVGRNVFSTIPETLGIGTVC